MADQTIDTLTALAAADAAAAGNELPAWFAAGVANARTRKVRFDTLRGALLRLGNVFDVKDPMYGAVGDGTTDDTTAFSNAAAAATAAGGIVVVPPSASGYKVSGSVIAANALWRVRQGDVTFEGNAQVGSGNVDPIVRFVVTQTNTGSSFNYGQRLSHDVSGTGDAAGYDFQMTTSGSGSRNHICPIQIRSVHNGTGTMTYLYGITIADTANSGAGAVTNYYGVDVQQPAGTGVLTNVAGLHVRDLGTRGATTTYAVLTEGTTASLFGGKVISYSGLHVGNVALDASSGLHIEPTTISGTAQYGSYVKMAGTSAATGAVIGISAGTLTAAAAFTTSFVAGIYVRSPAKGAGSTITTAYGLFIEDQTVGNTNYAIYTGAGVASFGGPLQLRAAAAAGTAGTLFLGNSTQTTVGAAGTAAAMPVPLGYLIAYLGTTKVAIPYFNG